MFRQVCILAAMAGVLTYRHPAYGFLAAFLLALFTLPCSSTAFARLPLPDGRKTFLFICAFCLGAAFAAVTATAPLAPEQHPSWVRDAAVPAIPPSERFKHGLAVSGIIRENTPLAGNRARLLLGDVRAAGEAEPLPGFLVLTWQNPPPFLTGAGPGQRLDTTLRIREIRGFANPGVWETESYWRDRNAFFRAWHKDDGTRNGKTPPARVTGEPPLFWHARAALREGVVGALLPGGLSTGTKTTAPAEEDGPRDGPEPAGEHTAAPSLSRSAAVIPALLFGDRSFFSPETLDHVAKATLAHSLALSGMHLGFAASIGYAAAFWLHFLFPTLFLHLPRQKAGLLLALPVCLAYLWIGGAPPSLVRAALMLLFWAVLLWLHRPKVLLDGLIWAVALILLVTPSALFDIRLQLSAISVAGIALVSPLLERLALTPPAGGAGRFRIWLAGMAKAVAGMGLISVAAQAAVLPIVLDAFPGTGVWFPLNLIWLPVLGIWVMPLCFAGLALIGLGLTAPAFALFWLAQIPCEGLFLLLDAMDAAGVLLAPVQLRPTGFAAAGYWTALLLLPTVFAKRALSRRTLLLLGVALVLGTTPSLRLPPGLHNEYVHVRLIDVGQGQAVAVAWNSGGAEGRILVDGGGFATDAFDAGRQIVVPVLTDNAAPRLDMIINSHPDADHLRGLLFPLETFAVGRAVFGPEGLNMKQSADVARCREILHQRKIPVDHRAAGDVLTLTADLALEVLHPKGNDFGVSANNASLALRLIWRGKPLALICGDMESRALGEMVRRGAALSAQILILPHHGAANAYSAGLYDAVGPEVALISCGYGTVTPRPAAKVRAAMEQRGIPAFSTADKGQILAEWDGKGNMRLHFARKTRERR